LNPIEEKFIIRKTRNGSAKINSLKPQTAYVVQLRAEVKYGTVTEPTEIRFTTPAVLNPVMNLEIRNIFENSATVTWKQNGTAPTRFIMITHGPYGERKTVILADEDNKDNAMTKLHNLVEDSEYKNRDTHIYGIKLNEKKIFVLQKYQT
jgi:hypothetical protein